ncbi:MAG: hypothetical protein KME20_09260 [Kaiparowitsia implicata GSE-PSE-MK54-09C]|nr:hypothetical protein [Kaiparowitsia implicata GSE-PSE-MK54-09C]
MSQHDVESQSEPSFEIRTRLGIFCRNVPILGYSLEPMPLTQSMLDQAVASTTHPGDRS